MGQSQACCRRSDADNTAFPDAEATKVLDGALSFKDSAPTSAPTTMDEMNLRDARHALEEDDLVYLDSPKTPPRRNTYVFENDVPLSKASDNIGDHVCPLVGQAAERSFVNQGMLQKLLEASKEDMGRNFSLDDSFVSDTMDESSVGIAMAVSDPNADDCPLVFISSGFEDLTGYTSEFVVGRSCRFLQPTSKIINDGINLGERKAMRAFCTEIQPNGTTIVNLLLNERQTGERFWNLLRMQYVMADGQQYILGVQCTLEAYMPKLLSRRLTSNEKNESIMGAIGDFVFALENVRAEIRKSEFKPIMELKAHFEDVLNGIQMLPSPTTRVGSEEEMKTSARSERPMLPASPSGKTRSIAPGCEVTIDEELKYPTYKVPAGSKGKVLTIDSFGTVTIEWKDVGKKNCLQRDVSRLRVTTRRMTSKDLDGRRRSTTKENEFDNPALQGA